MIPVACTYGEPLCDEVGVWFIYWLSSLCVEVGIARWLTPTNPSPRSMRSSTLLQGLNNFFNNYMSSLWLMWVHGLYAHSPFHTASLYYTGATFAGIMHPLFTFLKTATIPTYYGISIAIPRYITLQLSTVPLLWHAPSLSYCSLHDHVVDIVFVARPPSQFSYMSLLIHCISRYTAGGRHSYRVISCSSFEL